MSANSFTLQIVTVSKALFDGNAQQMECMGVSGAMTVLANHEPLITRIEPCTVRIISAGGKEENLEITGGVLEVAENKAVLLCSSNDGEQTVSA